MGADAKKESKSTFVEDGAATATDAFSVLGLLLDNKESKSIESFSFLEMLESTENTEAGVLAFEAGVPALAADVVDVGKTDEEVESATAAAGFGVDEESTRFVEEPFRGFVDAGGIGGAGWSTGMTIFSLETAVAKI